jgi:ribosomal protein S27AE
MYPPAPGPNHSGAWRYRRCPRCGLVAPASRFKILARGPAWTADGRKMRWCPACGEVRPTAAFTIVREERGSGR